MEKYDFSEQCDEENGAYKELDKMFPRERKAVYKAMQSLKDNMREQTIAQGLQWFDNAIFPTLRDFAEDSYSVLTIERNEKGIVVATLSNSNEMDIARSNYVFRMAILMADYFVVGNREDDVILSLTYDFRTNG